MECNLTAKTSVAILLSLVLVFSACKKEENKPNKDPEPDIPASKEITCVLISVSLGSRLLYTFTVNNLNQITEVKTFSSATFNGDMKINYDNKGRVAEVEFGIKPSSTSKIHKYYYNQFDLPIYRLVIYKSNAFEVDSFYYNENAQLIKIAKFLIRENQDSIFYIADRWSEYIYNSNGREDLYLKNLSSPDSDYPYSQNYFLFSEYKNQFALLSEYNLHLRRFGPYKYLPSYIFEIGINPSDFLEHDLICKYNQFGYPTEVKFQAKNDTAQTRSVYHIEYSCQ